MDEWKIAELLRANGISPSAQRVAIARYVLGVDTHPTADQVMTEVRKRFPIVSRATVYNTLNLLLNKGLLAHYNMGGPGGVFDPNVRGHHHFLDEETGQLLDISWDSLKVAGLESLTDVEISGYMVVIRGRRKKDAR